MEIGTKSSANKTSLKPLESGCLGAHFFNVTRKYSEQEAFGIYTASERRSISFRDFELLVVTAARRLQKQGVRSSSRVALIMGNDFDFILAFHALGLIGSVIVPLEPRAMIPELTELLNQARADFLLSSQQSLKTAESALQLSHSSSFLVDTTDWTSPLVLSNLSALEPSADIEFRASWTTAQKALVVFTSGTTGNPKGAMITWGNLYFQVQTVGPLILVVQSTRVLSILPMNHLFGLVAGVLIPFAAGMSTTFAGSFMPHEIIERMQKNQPSDMVVVPLFLKSLEKGLMTEIRRKRATRIYFQVASLISQMTPSKNFRRRLFFPVLKKLGSIRRFVSGGAPLPKDVQKFFETLGIEVSQGYGLTETSPIITFTRPGKSRADYVGEVIPGAELKIDENTGEIWTRGPHVMLGYEGRPELNAELIQDGWFRTGDVGSLSKDHFLKISGRIREIIVLGSGKKVFPDEVEDAAASIPGISEISVFGIPDQRAFDMDTELICAVVVPTSKDRTQGAEIHRQLQKAFQKISPYKRPVRIYLTNDELPKTPTKKNKRLAIKSLLLKKRIEVW